MPFSITLIGTENAVRRGLARTMEALTDLSLNNDDAGSVELVLAEVLNNIVEHALACTSGESTIEVRGEYKAQQLCLTIIDQGKPMPTGSAPDALQPDLNVPVCEMPEGGFGWFMIHTLAQDVHYTRVDQSNYLTLRMTIGLQALPPATR